IARSAEKRRGQDQPSPEQLPARQVIVESHRADLKSFSDDTEPFTDLRRELLRDDRHHLTESAQQTCHRLERNDAAPFQLYEGGHWRTAAPPFTGASSRLAPDVHIAASFLRCSRGHCHRPL